MEHYYSVAEDGEFEECPVQVALDFFNYDGYDGQIIQIYIGEAYKPTNQDEIDWMESEGYQFCMKNVEPYAKYKYHEKNDSVEILN